VTEKETPLYDEGLIDVLIYEITMELQELMKKSALKRKFMVTREKIIQLREEIFYSHEDAEQIYLKLAKHQQKSFIDMKKLGYLQRIIFKELIEGAKRRLRLLTLDIERTKVLIYALDETLEGKNWTLKRKETTKEEKPIVSIKPDISKEIIGDVLTLKEQTFDKFF